MNSQACAVSCPLPTQKHRYTLASVIAAWLLNFTVFVNIFVLQGA